ncbi:MAG: DUF4410 domain-containing protein [Dongiaceae bacterium]
MRWVTISLLACSVALSACGSDTDAEITNKMYRKDRKNLPPPTQILVYDFAVSPSEVAADSAASNELRGAGDDPYNTAQKTSLEHQIAAIVADKVVEDLQDLDLPAMRWHGPAPTGPGIYTIEGQFVTIDEGNAAMRMIVGFGAGGTEIKTLVQAYASEPTGKRLLAEAEVSSESSNAPGLAATLPVGSAISGIGTAAAIQTGVGTVREINTDVREGAEETGEAIVELMKPRLEKLGWIDD